MISHKSSRSSEEIQAKPWMVVYVNRDGIKREAGFFSRKSSAQAKAFRVIADIFLRARCILIRNEATKQGMFTSI